MSDKTDEEKAAEAKAAADKAAAEKAAAEKATKKLKLRVIADHADHAINDVVSLTPDEAKAAVDGGWADDNPAAVKYAESLAKAAKADDADEG